MRISVFGLGYVGCTIAACLSEKGNNVVGMDINKHKTELINRGKVPVQEPQLSRMIRRMRDGGRLWATSDATEAVKKTDLSIICVGTSLNRNNKLNMNNVLKASENIAEGIKHKTSFHVIVIKSTVLPGTNRRVNRIIRQKSGKKDGKDFCVISNPEFLREGQTVKDYYNAPFIVLGGDDKKGLRLAKKMYSNLNISFEIMSPEAAEMLKYASNLFHALKISFANEIGNICKELTIDSHKVMDIFCRDKRLNISSLYLKPGFAYGGSCLPKDLGAFVSQCRKHKISCPVIKSVKYSNEEQKKRLLNLVLNSGKRKIGIFGISFKRGTDDLRNSPIIDIITALLSRGFKIKVFDENVDVQKLIGANKAYIKSKIPRYEKIILDDLDKTLSQSELIVINHPPGKLISKLRDMPPRKTIIDLVHIKELRNRKNYIGINW